MPLIVFVLIVLFAACMLGGYLLENGRRPEGFIWLLVVFAVVGAGAFGFAGIFISCMVWGGFTIDDDPSPPWTGYVPCGASLVGTLLGIAGACLIARRTDPRRVRERRATEADYDETGHVGPPDRPKSGN